MDWDLYVYSAKSAHPFRRNGAPFRFKLSKAQQVVMVKHFCNIYGSKNAEWLSLVYWDCLVYPAIRASYGVRYPL